MARLRLIENAGVRKPALLRAEDPDAAEVIAVLSQADPVAAIIINDASAGLMGAQSDRFPQGGDIHGRNGHLVIPSAGEYAI